MSSGAVSRAVPSIRRHEEFLEPICEARRSRDEVPGARRDQPLGVQLDGESVANPLQRGRVAT